MALKPFVLQNILKPAYANVVTPLVFGITSRRPFGTNVFSKDWDILIILDTCRVDALRSVAENYEWLPASEEIDSIWSVGSATMEWIANTFTREYADEVQKTLYVTGNAQARKVLEQRTFPEDQEGIWAQTNWQTVAQDSLPEIYHGWEYENQDVPGAIHPARLTDVAIQAWEENGPERMIIHYSQPHHPYPFTAVREGREMNDIERRPFDYLMAGGDRDRVWNLYIESLEVALDNVANLVRAIDDSKMTISADHGDAFGEWGHFSHPFAAFVPQIRKVPWAELSSLSGSYEPSTDVSKLEKQTTVEEQLKHLGYL